MLLIKKAIPTIIIINPHITKNKSNSSPNQLLEKSNPLSIATSSHNTIGVIINPIPHFFRLFSSFCFSIILPLHHFYHFHCLILPYPSSSKTTRLAPLLLRQ